MTSTLALLLDVQIPHSSIGCLIPDFFENFSQEDQLYFYYYNTLHLMEKLKAKFDFKQVQLDGKNLNCIFKLKVFQIIFYL